jgi:ubiquinone/menaquinone biosynthesis C-methylase UbiE
MADPDRSQLFDDWPEKYERWFTTPIGSLVRGVEWELVFELLKPGPGDFILDAGCGTGIFTLDMLSCGARVIGLDLSLPMVKRSARKALALPFHPVLGNILSLPFPDDTFGKTVSITALEFIPDAEKAVQELFRVTRKGGVVVVATLNRLSPWAERRKEEAKKGHRLFQRVVFRSPDELAALAPLRGETRTAVHFLKDENPERAARVEEEGRRKELDTGAFLAARWAKP